MINIPSPIRIIAQVINGKRNHVEPTSRNAGDARYEIDSGIDGVTGDVLTGWARLRGDDRPLSLEIVVGTKLLGVVTADLPREDLEQTEIGRGNHGFSFAFPAGLAAGVHQVVVRSAETGIQLAGSPFQYETSAHLAEKLAAPLEHVLEGYIDDIIDDTVIGWARHPGRDSAVMLEIMLDKASIGIVEANLYREDVERAGKGRGYHGFRYPIPRNLADGFHNLVVRSTETGQMLDRSPFEFRSWSGHVPSGTGAAFNQPLMMNDRFDLSRFATQNVPNRILQNICSRLAAAGLIDDLADLISGLATAGRTGPGVRFEMLASCVAGDAMVQERLNYALTSGHLTPHDMEILIAYFERFDHHEEADRVRAYLNDV